ncbi:hypothetical protein X759_35165 [Mesorhizobium sp. LSHC420B00]|nr:hypothetical protein X759_35165 [Mesorhizobium sp. LSHC420B00]
MTTLQSAMQVLVRRQGEQNKEHQRVLEELSLKAERNCVQKRGA